jgi:serine/threonine protein kinase
MAFLHTAFPTPLIHRDLKSLNLLVSQNWTLKISDFGLSRFRGRTMGQQCGTTQWMAPEIIRTDGRDYDEKVDVFSFGVNLWELMTRRIPWDRIPNVKERVLAGGRVPLDVVEPGAPVALVELSKRCMSESPQDRPTFPEIVREVQRIARVWVVEGSAAAVE